ncbi:MAG TPA: hypothetical protein VK569_05410 [Bacteroidota bacterium]|nr:hypothetical protein [Bacteroidota bacterium]
MELKKELIGEYTGSFAPSVSGTTLLVRNRTRIYQSEKGHLSYVITEQTIDRQRSLTRRETYVGLVTAEGPQDETGECRLHLSPLDKPYRGESLLRCDFRFSADFNSYFLVFDCGEGPERIQFRLKKTSPNGSGRRRKRA